MTAKGVMLALETSQREQSVALRLSENEILVERVETSDRDRDDLMPAIDRLCHRSKIGPGQIEVVALNQGPGGFTGLRIAHATAQAMSFALGCRLVQVNAAAAAAEASRLAGTLPVDAACWVALACKGLEAWSARVSADRGAPPTEMRSREACEWEPGDVQYLIADPHLPPSWHDRAVHHRISIVPLAVTAEAVARIAQRLLLQGVVVPPDAALPLYPREAEAVRLWRQRKAACTDGIRQKT